jgi:hypothetical protein
VPAQAARYHVGAESELVPDRWVGLRAEGVDRRSLRQRLSRDAVELAGPEGAPVWFVSDLELGTDIGVPDAELDATPDARRTLLDLHRAWLGARVGPLELRFGRHDRIDEAGWDTLDGATVRVSAAPFLAVEASGGLAVRRGWSDFGPDLASVDGTRLLDEPGWIVGGALATRGLTRLHGRAAYRRELQHDGGDVVRETAAAALEVAVLPRVWLTGGADYAVPFRTFSEVRAGIRSGLGTRAGLAAEWRRTRPTYSAESIWFAFGPTAHHRATVAAHVGFGPWRVDADAGVRVFDSGELDAQAPGLLADAGEVEGVERRPISVGGGARLTRMLQDGGLWGAEARAEGGHGGRRSVGDVFGRVPIVVTPGQRPLVLRGRMGAVHIDQGHATPVLGSAEALSGWLLTAVGWQASEAAHLECVGETHHSAHTPLRLRVMARLTLRDTW